MTVIDANPPAANEMSTRSFTKVYFRIRNVYFGFSELYFRNQNACSSFNNVYFCVEQVYSCFRKSY